MKPRIKFNDGAGAILCNMCSVILKENLSEEEFNGETDLLLCSNCKIRIEKRKNNDMDFRHRNIL